MDAFQWDECFVTGVAMVDEQHHELVNIMNRFGEVLMKSNNSTQAELDRVFGELAVYSRYHFQEEETMMQAMGLDGRHVKHHCEDHAKFLQDVTRMHAAAVPAEHEGARSLGARSFSSNPFHGVGCPNLAG
jgi:hemerythrin